MALVNKTFKDLSPRLCAYWPRGGSSLLELLTFHRVTAETLNFSFGDCPDNQTHLSANPCLFVFLFFFYWGLHQRRFKRRPTANVCLSAPFSNQKLVLREELRAQLRGSARATLILSTGFPSLTGHACCRINHGNSLEYRNLPKPAG